MNNDAAQSAQLIASLLEKLPQTEAEVIIAPSFVNLALAAEKTKGSPLIVAAQNMHFAEKGAFTGEVSAAMLEAIGVKTVILGPNAVSTSMRPMRGWLKRWIQPLLMAYVSSSV